MKTLLKRILVSILAVVFFFSMPWISAFSQVRADSEQSQDLLEEDNTQEESDSSDVVASFDVPIDEIPNISEEEWEEMLQEEAEDASDETTEEMDLIQVMFTNLPEGAFVQVFQGEEEILPEEDGSFFLSVGEYQYFASCEGYEPIFDEVLTVEDAEEGPVEVSVLMVPVNAEDDIEESDDSEPTDPESADSVPVDETTEEEIFPEDSSTEEIPEESEETEESAEEETADEAEEDEQLPGWKDYLAEQGIAVDSLDKEAYAATFAEYALFCETWKREHGIEAADGAAYGGSFSNDYLSVAVADTGRFTIGTVNGNPNYDSDNHQKLLYGHPEPGTSETLIVIGDSYSEFFRADAISYADTYAVAVMYIDAYDIVVTQTLKLVESGNATYADTVRIEYRVTNNGDSAQNVGIRIMLDTMLASNDYAPFKITGTGNVTTCKTYTGSNIPQSYQVYDDLDQPTTLATGYLFRSGERKPDKVQFCSWPDIKDSSWDHTVADGSTLGDSAVGIYFNQTSIAAKATMTVSTYYGVSVGSGISGGSSGQPSVSGSEICFQVKDSATDQPVADVTVQMIKELTPVTHVTDENGYVTFSLSDENGLSSYQGVSTQFRLSKTGYKTQTYTKTVKKGMMGTLYIGKTNVPVLTSAFLGDTDLLSDTVHFIEDSNDKIERGTADKLGTARIVVTSDMPDCVFYFMEDARVIDKNKTGIFELKTLKTSSGTLIEKLKSQGNRYIKCVSANGVSSNKLRIGLKVSIPSVSTSGLADGGLDGLLKSLKLGDIWPSGKAPIVEGTLAALFLGDSFEFGPLKKNDDLKLKFEITEDQTIKVSLNMEKMPESKKKAADLFKEKNSKAFEKSIKNFGIKQKKIGFGQFVPSFSIYGYGEGQIEDGHVRVDLHIGIIGSIKSDYTVQFFFVVPLYITVGGELSCSAEAGANLMNGEGLNFEIYQGEIHPAFSMWLEGGVGAKGICNLGVEGKATLDVNIDLAASATNVSLTGAASLKACFLFFEKSLTFAEGTVKIYDSNDQDGTVYGGDENIWEEFEAAPFHLVSRDYLSADGTDGSEAGELMNDYQYSRPKVISVDGKQYRFWIWDNPDLPISNSNTLVYSVLEDGYWSEAVPVLDDGTSDFFYDVAADDEYLYVVWHNSNTTFDDSTVQPENVSSAAEICYARIDRATGEKQVLRLSNNTEMDTLPAISVINGTSYVAWYHTANGVLENTQPNYLYYTSVRNDEIGEVTSINCGSGFVSDISAAVIGGAPIATYLVDNSQSLSSIDAVSCSVDMSNGTTASRGDGAGKTVVGSMDGKNLLFWYDNGNIAYAQSLEDSPNYVFDEENLPNSVPQDFIVVTHQGMPYLIWTVNAEIDSNLKQAAAVRFVDGEWSSPFILDTLDYGSISSMSAYENENGNLVLSYMRLNYDTDGTLLDSDMQEKEIQQNLSIRIEDVSYDTKDAAPGQELPVNVIVTNTGNEIIENLNVEISSSVMDENFQTEFTGLHLLPGATGEIEITGFVLSDSLEKLYEGDSPYSFDIVLTSDEYSYDSSWFEVGYTVLELSQQNSIIFDNHEYIPVYLENTSGFDAENVHVRVLADSEDGTLVYDEVYDIIPAYQSVCFYIEAEALVNTNKLFASATTNSLQEENEIQYKTIYLSNEALLLQDPVDLTVLAGEGGTVEDVSGEYLSDDEVTLTAVPDEGYVFESWASDQPVSFEDRYAAETTIILPDCGATVTAYFVREEERDFTLSESELELQVGESARLKAIFADNIAGKVQWSAEDPSVATVSQGGEVTAIAAGQTTILAQCGSYTRECVVQVEDVPISEIHVVYPSISLSGLGATAEIETLITPEKASSPILWTTSDDSIVTVSDTGLATAVGYGVAEITGTAENDGAILGICTVTVINTLTTISIEPDSVQLDLSKPSLSSTDLQVVFDPVDSTDEKTITWTNYSEDIVSIEASGENNEYLHVTAQGNGDAILQAKTETGLEAWVTIHVTTTATGIHFTLSSSGENPQTIYEGKYLYAEAVLEPDGAEGTIEWSSSDTSVARVNNDGEIYAVAPGTAVITASYDGLEDDLYVCVIRDEIIVTDLEEFQSGHNYDSNMNRSWIYTFDGAAAITLTFSDTTEFESGYDYLYIMTGDDETVKVATGQELASQSVMIPGNTVRLRLTSDGSVTDYGFKVTAITIHYPNGWHKLDGKWYYYKDLNPVTGWRYIGSKWYYFKTDGVMATGWQKVGGKWYYLNASGAMLTGWQEIGGKWYYFNTGGDMVTGWQKISSKWYYFNTGGDMVTGWQKISNKWYYFNSSGAMLTGWQKISSKWYYFNSSGAMLTGWQKISTKWYYFNSSGAMLTGWQKISNKWYYFNSSGAMLANTSQKIGTKTYYFDSNGVCTNP